MQQDNLTCTALRSVRRKCVRLAGPPAKQDTGTGEVLFEIFEAWQTRRALTSPLPLPGDRLFYIA